MTSRGRLTARIDASYCSTTDLLEFNLPAYQQAPYGLANINLIWDSPDQRFSIRAYATNITNTAYKMSMKSNTLLDNTFGTWGDPRVVGAEVKVPF